MLRFHRLLAALAVVALLLLSIGVAAARNTNGPQERRSPPARPTARPNVPTRITWTPRRINQPVTAGAAVQITANFVSSTDIAEATLVIPGELGRIMKPNTPTLRHIVAGVQTTVTFIIMMPAKKAHSQAGVVQMLSGRKVLAEPLQVALNLQKPAGGSVPRPEPTSTPRPEPTAMPQPEPTATSAAYPGPTQP